jgi:hypothetical protein
VPTWAQKLRKRKIMTTKEAKCQEGIKFVGASFVELRALRGDAVKPLPKR